METDTNFFFKESWIISILIYDPFHSRSLTGQRRTISDLYANDTTSISNNNIVINEMNSNKIEDTMRLPSTKPLDIRGFFIMDPRRERLYRNIDRRCEVSAPNEIILIVNIIL